MCGISGWIDNKSVDRSVMESMTHELRHRGPDAQQIITFDNIGLGHARLSIIDLSENANQPMYNEDKSLWLVYNGEFYNFQFYREELIKKGHRFISNTDSEVLLHLYEEDGPEFVKKLRGMFAFGLWDGKQKQLMLARDRVGKKPLYYFHRNGTFLFASELKALLAHPAVDREISPEGINYYFMLGYIPRQFTVFKSIKKLLPGNYLIYKNGEIAIYPYWTLPNRVNTDLNSEEECVDKLLNILEESVKLRMISDVPLGIFLSGGVDSSIVATLMARNSSKPVKTFTIGFEESKYNELPYARQVARHIGSHHHELIVRMKQVEILEKLIYHFDEPFADSSAIPTYYVSKMAKDHVTVVLSGDGGDELFGGYNWYNWVLRRTRVNFIPFFIRKKLSLFSNMPSFNYRGKRFLNDICLDEFNIFYERTRFFSDIDIKHLLNHDIHSNTGAYRNFYEKIGKTCLERMTKTDFFYYLPDDIMTKVDRASMAVSLEARAPMLDHHLCEFAFSLSDKLKINKGIKKYLLKRIAKNLLPDNFLLERKQGFSIPLAEWMRGDLGKQIIDVINDNNIRKIINPVYVEQLLQQHRINKMNQDSKLWAVLVFGLWARKYL